PNLSMKKAAVLLLLLGLSVSPALAQQEQPRTLVTTLAAAVVAPPELPFSFDGPAPPALPTTMIRDDEGKTTVRAVRVPTALKIDGLLDEAIYRTVTPISDFI